MIPVEIKNIIDIIGCTVLKKGGISQVSSISIDSRTINQGELFWAIKGEKFDGNNYAYDAAEKNAAGVVVSCEPTKMIKQGCWVLLVDDTLKALQTWAKKYRQRFPVPFIGITGTVGKTTVRNMVTTVLEKKYNVTSTKGNFNGQVGVPLSLMQLSFETQIAVLEMGISIPGEMNSLSEMVQPGTGILTAISPVHMEYFHGMENLIANKLAMFKGSAIPETAIINADHQWVEDVKKLLPVKPLFYGWNEEAVYRVAQFEELGSKGSRFSVITPGGKLELTLPIPGKHYVLNSLAAIACGQIHGIENQLIIEALEGFKPVPMRMCIRKVGAVTVLNDAYNASPESMKLALQAFSTIPGKRHVAVLGDMLELGDYEESAHEELAHSILQNSVDIVFTVGEKILTTVRTLNQLGYPGESIISVQNAESAAEKLLNLVQNGDVILLKASRLLELEKIETRLIQYIS